MKKLILIIVVIGLLSCLGNKEQIAEYNPKAIEMNNKAGKLLQEFKHDSALILFNQAIELDDSYYLPHLNKTGIYLHWKQYNKALAEIELVVKKKPDFAQGWFLAGLLNEHQANDGKAMDYYNKSIQIYSESIRNPDEEKNLNANKLNRALSKKFTGDESYIEDFDELAEAEDLSFIVGLFKDMTKQEVMDAFLNSTVNPEGVKLNDLNTIKIELTGRQNRHPGMLQYNCA